MMVDLQTESISFLPTSRGTKRIGQPYVKRTKSPFASKLSTSLFDPSFFHHNSKSSISFRLKNVIAPAFFRCRACHPVKVSLNIGRINGVLISLEKQSLVPIALTPCRTGNVAYCVARSQCLKRSNTECESESDFLPQREWNCMEAFISNKGSGSSLNQSSYMTTKSVEDSRGVQYQG